MSSFCSTRTTDTAEHGRMIDALSARDSKAMSQVLIEHLNRKRDTVLELLRAGEIYPRSKATKT